MANRYDWMADTSPEALAALIRIQRAKTPGEKLVQVFEMIEMGMRADEDRIRKKYPAASKREIFLRAAAERLGRETVIRVYGWDPESGEAP